ncbi:glyoxysomal fatty acid beta-oxidation multifunctional protein MFP-a [Dorcoceras hygrometricum]|uniref:Glyoxysomal fatty acid beta-oxidation multifunctional protein MFP-a n=1 Tax=Dorcoceras hygrometricum TaxID=472368 RepID=A0A2Z7BPV3_9LAMI|nr:glyoxysomal fatty acid beta-oxidation multifunctional protein MFP-a [Dorcoceras hygrometricum]
MKESRFWSWTGLALSTAIYREEPGSCNSGWSQAQVPARSRRPKYRRTSTARRRRTWRRHDEHHRVRWPRACRASDGRSLRARRASWPVSCAPGRASGRTASLKSLRGLKGPYLAASFPPLSNAAAAAAAAARLRRKFVSGQFDEENPFVLISSVLLVQADEGVSFLVMDRIGDIYRSLPRRADVIVTTVGARHKCQQGFYSMFFRCLAGGRIRIPNSDWSIEISRNSRHATAACGGALSFPPHAHARATTMRAGRAWWLEAVLHDAQALRMRRPRTAALPRARDACWPCSCGAPVARLARGGRPLVVKAARSLPLLANRCRCLDAPLGRVLLAERYRATLAVEARCCGAGRRRPPLRRVSGDVVTAGLISSMVWFGPVRAGREVFSGRYAMSGPILVDFEILSFWA